MSEVVNVKLKNGDDIIGIIRNDEKDFIVLENPVQIGTDPEFGVYGISWLMFSTEDIVSFDKSDIFYLHSANDKSIGYYEEFVDTLYKKEVDVNSNNSKFSTELEDIFNAIMQSKNHTKH